MCIQDVRNLPVWLLILCCFFNSKHNGLFLTDGRISGAESHLDGGFALPIGGFHAISGDTNNNKEMDKCWWTNKTS